MGPTGAAQGCRTPGGRERGAGSDRLPPGSSESPGSREIVDVNKLYAPCHRAQYVGFYLRERAAFPKRRTGSGGKRANGRWMSLSRPCHWNTLGHSVLLPLPSFRAMVPRILPSFPATSRPRSDISGIKGSDPIIRQEKFTLTGTGFASFDARKVVHGYSPPSGTTPRPSSGDPPPRGHSSGVEPGVTRRPWKSRKAKQQVDPGS